MPRLRTIIGCRMSIGNRGFLSKLLQKLFAFSNYLFSYSDMEKVSSIILFIFCLLLLGGCTFHQGGEQSSGYYEGTDGAKDLPAKAQITVAITGDGIMTASWNSEGSIQRARLIGHLGLLDNPFVLTVLEGRCKGEFKGSFTIENDVIKGNAKQNASCPEQFFNFNFKRVASFKH